MTRFIYAIRARWGRMLRNRAVRRRHARLLALHVISATPSRRTIKGLLP